MTGPATPRPTRRSLTGLVVLGRRLFAGPANLVWGLWHRTASVPHHAIVLWQRLVKRGHHRHPVARAGGLWGGLLAVTLVGLGLGMLLGGVVSTHLGPFHATLRLGFSLDGGTEVTIPPLGSLEIGSHSGPLQLRIGLESLDEIAARKLVNDPSGIDAASGQAVTDLSLGVRQLAMRAAGAGVLGALILSALVYRRMRRVATSGCLAIGLLVSGGMLVTATFHPDAIQEPRYQGLLTNAPAVIGDAKEIADRFQAYRDQLQRLVLNVSRLYGTLSTLPVYEPDAETTRVLHISDMHLNPSAWSIVQTVVQQFKIQVVVDTGDITDWGSEPEASYVGAISQLKVPYVYIRGNHDSVNTANSVASQPNAYVLDSSVKTVAGLTFAGNGDPRFTPDKSTGGSRNDRELLTALGASLASRIRSSYVTVDVALVHDPVEADELAFTCPVVLAGHTHERQVRRLNGSESSPTHDRTLLMVQGSTGGAGLRGLEHSEPTTLDLSVLYFNKYRKIQAYDDIQVGGTGLSQVTLERHIVQPDEGDTASPSVSSPPNSTSSPGVSSGSGSPSPTVSVS